MESDFKLRHYLRAGKASSAPPDPKAARPGALNSRSFLFTELYLRSSNNVVRDGWVEFSTFGSGGGLDA